jgi:branched-chain amino acid transport system ATP-binding protein
MSAGAHGRSGSGGRGPSRPDEGTDQHARPRLEVCGLGKRFGGLRAVHDVSFTACDGERIGLLGPNGAGKTTLTNLIAGDIKPTDGEVCLDGEPVTGRPPHQLFRRGLARTYQVANPFPALTVMDGVMIGGLARTRDVASARAAARSALELLNLGGRGETPMRSLTIVEMKTVELARIVASGASLIFLDEVLAGLRPNEVDDLLDVLDALAHEQGLTVVMIEHLIGAVMRFCERLIVMNEGAVIADGPAEDVARDDAVIDAYLGAKWRTTNA